MENKTIPSFALLTLLSLVICLPGCVTHKEGYVNGTVIINGSASSQNMDRYVIEAGEGMDPTSWTMLGVILVNGGSASRDETFLGELNTSMLPDGKYTIRLTVTDKNGVTSVDRVYVNIDNVPNAQTRTCPVWTCAGLAPGANTVNISIPAEGYGSNMDCSVNCTCQGAINMGIKTEGDLEYGYDYLKFGAENLTGMWEGVYGPYNSTTKIRFTSDRSVDGSGGYGGFNITQVLCSNYCISYAADYGGEYISRVALGTGVMSSNESHYSNYQSASLTQLQRGRTYTLYADVTLEDDYSYKEYVKAWIDYNQNNNLNDTGEEIDMGTVQVNDSYTFSKTFTVPANAALGKTTMRVTDRWYTTPNACDRITYGEVEDYTVDIVDSLTSTTTTTSTTIPGQCSMQGDDPPCDEVTLAEVIAHINKWSAGTAGLSEIIDLINAWAQGN
ncbi:MAG: GEVED domain-containing protein [Candidatus Altiarchaeia archaeon]